MRNEFQISGADEIARFLRPVADGPAVDAIFSRLREDGIAVLPGLVTLDALRAMQEAFATRLQRTRWNNFEGYQKTEPYRHLVEDVLTLDQGFVDLFAVAQKHGYRDRLSFTNYTVFIAKADRTKDSAGQYSPDIAVAAGQYAGGYYDQGGYVYAAGMVLAYNPSSFILAEHERDYARISNVVRYEGEHIVLYYNDRPLYEKTADHSKGGGHPILN